MSKRVLLLHGWGGSDYPHWQSWLASELVKDYGCVNFLRFSNYDEPKLDVWLDELKTALESFKPDIVVCHSLANSLWFHLCNREEIELLERLYLVAPPSMGCKVEELAEFFPVKAPRNLYANRQLLVVSTNDPYMSLDEAEALQKELDVNMKVIPNAGHLNAESGYGKWEWILQELTENTIS